MSGRFAGSLRTVTSGAILVVAALAISAGTTHAAPVPTADSPDIGYAAHAEGTSVVTSIDAGTFRITDAEDAVEVVDDSGTVVAALPLTIRVGEAVYPIDVDLAERTLRLTPRVPADVAQSLKSVADEGFDTQDERDDKALADFNSYLGYATLIGGLIFGVVFGVVGLVVGCGLFAVTLVGAPVGCLGGLMAGFAAGGLVGTIVVGGAALAILGIQYLVTVNTPFVPPAPTA
ncbi:hypothetical protein R4282_13120 [Rhodococcus oxybenzonivorans]|jgi:hypothetical protein|uniref:hypothetical protein n=1 Tax=Rhodococcus TaxID=1827 RepID=UPI0020307DA7|nr:MULTISPECIES: hypothetical protein [Rhodococcus]MDV7353946.1 hypothetical protein [Rhodococcus oxybenzonivorans]